MNITRIAGLAEDEMNKLVEAGKLLKTIKLSAENKEFDVIAPDLKDLITALKNVCEGILADGSTSISE